MNEPEPKPEDTQDTSGEICPTATEISEDNPCITVVP